MKKITLLFFLAILSSYTASAQFTFPSQGPFIVTQNTPVTVNINDASNTAGVPAGQYSKITITVDWQDLSTAGVFTTDNALEIFIGGTSSISLDSPTSDTPTTLTFIANIPGFYEPGVDGALDLELKNTFGDDAQTEWSNVTVTLDPKPACPQPSNVMESNVTATSADLSWTPGDTETLWNVELVDTSTGGSQTMVPTQSGLTTASYSATSLTTNVTYLFYVQADCGATDGTSEWLGPYGFVPNEPCNAPTNIMTTSITSTSVDLTWDQESTALNGYTVFIFNQGDDQFFDFQVDDTTITDQTITTASFTGLTANTNYDVYIRSNCDSANFRFSDFSSPITFSTSTLSSDSFEKGAFKLYPNPIADLLTIETNYDIEQFSILNSLGQEVITSNKLNNNQINISDLKSGLYFVKLKADNKQKILRVIKK
ncbi:fibronectin type III domain-containing protein [uncultured Algibacter sp.]|uniref:fibronectin type III domain-containing protein n=1 Tax=uncultured Algibacter sp. TaxID=298659 RepID=UPI0032173B08